MSALIYIVETLLSLALFVVVARLLLQLARADFRNPLCQAIVRLTNPLVLPLRRVLPPIGKVDTASVVAVVVIAAVEVAVKFGLQGIGWVGPWVWLHEVALEIASMLLQTYFYAIILYALLSLVAPGGYSPLQSLLGALCEPVLRPLRRVIPAIAGIDLSALWACILIQALLILLHL
ncbi:MAG: YggT family protein [Steroidobacteraceae bacterium]